MSRSGNLPFSAHDRRPPRSLAAIATAVLLVGCATAHQLAPPALTTGTWRVRIDVDSAPDRQLPKQPTFGTIDFAAHRYAIDFRRALNRTLPAGAVIAPVAEAQNEYRIILGDSSSFDYRIVMRGRLVARDSIVGTWTETIICCSAVGRFSLWRSPPQSSRAAATVVRFAEDERTVDIVAGRE